VGDTDAEGRLVLADTLAWVDAELKPDVVIDVATLTGAARIALGNRYAPVYSTDDSVLAALVSAGEATGETLWPMPLFEDYAAQMASTTADVCSTAKAGTGAGSITAALFLQTFAGNRPWAHLDIAGAGRRDGRATGFGARLLLEFLSALARK
jgi:leucyl aminopeptidase